MNYFVGSLISREILNLYLLRVMFPCVETILPRAVFFLLYPVWTYNKVLTMKPPDPSINFQTNNCISLNLRILFIVSGKCKHIV